MREGILNPKAGHPLWQRASPVIHASVPRGAAQSMGRNPELLIWRNEWIPPEHLVSVRDFSTDIYNPHFLAVVFIFPQMPEGIVQLSRRYICEQSWWSIASERAGGTRSLKHFFPIYRCQYMPQFSSSSPLLLPSLTLMGSYVCAGTRNWICVRRSVVESRIFSFIIDWSTIYNIS